MAAVRMICVPKYAASSPPRRLSLAAFFMSPSLRTEVNMSQALRHCSAEYR